MEAKTNISPSLEDYLEAILSLQKKNGNVRVTDVALEMGISKPSVNNAIKNLKSQELVLHEHYGLLQLTEKGYTIAKNITDRHQIIKKFLTDILGIDEPTADDEACKIEHTVSTKTIECLNLFVKNYLRGIK